ncbi:fibronectin [Bacillus toyonensis]|nr:fibronectin [Bacillus toyonensis]PEL68460.1 fibronectin [Bacillus toyonensis]PGD43234.1 fibronectin [Bacillus toyonensis]PGD78475.1 fibronectin [Bacillus toyonensis]PGF00787.1 fibronectin [Bacillus toyonensis]
MPTDIHVPPKIGVSHLHIFEEGVFCRKTINSLAYHFLKMIW